MDDTRLGVGQWKKVESNKEVCEVCGNECPLLFRLQNQDTNREQKVCEGCFNNYYTLHPVKG